MIVSRAVRHYIASFNRVLTIIDDLKKYYAQHDAELFDYDVRIVETEPNIFVYKLVVKIRR